LGHGSEEDDVSDATPALDEAFERMAAASFELPNGFVNHGAHGLRGAGQARLRRRHRQLGAPVRPGGGASVDPLADFEDRPG
jgi:hypothetical protein